MRQYEMFELTYTAPAPAGSQAEIELNAVFSCGGERVAVKGFYSGDET